MGCGSSKVVHPVSTSNPRNGVDIQKKVERKESVSAHEKDEVNNNDWAIDDSLENIRSPSTQSCHDKIRQTESDRRACSSASLTSRASPSSDGHLTTVTPIGSCETRFPPLAASSETRSRPPSASSETRFRRTSASSEKSLRSSKGSLRRVEVVATERQKSSNSAQSRDSGVYEPARTDSRPSSTGSLKTFESRRTSARQKLLRISNGDLVSAELSSLEAVDGLSIVPRPKSRFSNVAYDVLIDAPDTNNVKRRPDKLAGLERRRKSVKSKKAQTIEEIDAKMREAEQRRKTQEVEKQQKARLFMHHTLTSVEPFNDRSTAVEGKAETLGSLPAGDNRVVSETAVEEFVPVTESESNNLEHWGSIPVDSLPESVDERLK